MPNSSDSIFMSMAIELSKRGFPAPNPHVGCVIVQNGSIVGKGFHEFAGGDHAEIAALKEAGQQARDATAYVTLEPCIHYGRTGPCSEALIEAGIRRVCFAIPDPNPKAGGGAQRLKESGVAVEVGLASEEARDANLAWLSAVARRSPYVVAKVALTLDGKTARADGTSKWITGKESRTQGHRLRAECGAVLVGANTVRIDNPELTVRHLSVVNQPVRIVLDPRGTLSPNSNVFNEKARTLWFKEGGTEPNRRSVKVDENGIDLGQLLSDLYDEGLTSILIEGGAITLGRFLRADLVDRLEMFYAPKVFGEGMSWSGDADLSGLDLEVADAKPLGEDFWVTLYPRRR